MTHQLGFCLASQWTRRPTLQSRKYSSDAWQWDTLVLSHAIPSINGQPVKVIDQLRAQLRCQLREDTQWYPIFSGWKHSFSNSCGSVNGFKFSAEFALLLHLCLRPPWLSWLSTGKESFFKAMSPSLPNIGDKKG